MATPQENTSSDNIKVEVEVDNDDFDNQDSTAGQNLEETIETAENPNGQNDGIRVTNKAPGIRVTGTNPQPSVPILEPEDVRGLITGA